MPVRTIKRSMLLGIIHGSTEDGMYRVSLVDLPDAVVTCLALESAVRDGELDVGDVVVVHHEGGTDSTGVILGRRALPGTAARAREADFDTPETLVLEAREELTLRVGDGSITIRKDGKILIRGTDLVSHARRMNRVKGGAVSIN